MKYSYLYLALALTAPLLLFFPLACSSNNPTAPPPTATFTPTVCVNASNTPCTSTQTFTPTSTPTVTFTVTNTATDTPCGYPGVACTSTLSPTFTPTGTLTPTPGIAIAASFLDIQNENTSTTYGLAQVVIANNSQAVTNASVTIVTPSGTYPMPFTTSGSFYGASPPYAANAACTFHVVFSGTDHPCLFTTLGPTRQGASPPAPAG